MKLNNENEITDLRTSENEIDSYKEISRNSYIGLRAIIKWQLCGEDPNNLRHVFDEPML